MLRAHLRGLVDWAFWGHLRGELLALRIGDIDMKDGTVSVRQQIVETDAGPVESPPKAGSQRVVHLPRKASRRWPRTCQPAPRRCRLLGCS
jgi:integrase